MPRGTAIVRALTRAWLSVALLAAAGILPSPAAEAAPRSHAVVAGSSTMFPFAAAVAERQARPGPLVLPMGSGAGIAWFCEGLGPATPDIVLASRAMTSEEVAACRAAGVAPIEELQAGVDGIVLARHHAGELRELPLADLWLALAARVPDPEGSGRWVANPFRLWSEIRPELPAVPIQVLGPPATSGTRDAFTVLAMIPACRAAVAADPGNAGELQHCGELRRDGAWEDAGEDDDALVARLQANPHALGVLGYGAVMRHPGRVLALCIDGRCPATAAIQAGEYPLSRPLFLYLKSAHLAFVPGLEAYVEDFLAADAVAADGYLARLGLVAAPRVDRPVRASQPAAASLAETSTPLWLIAAALLAVLIAVGAGIALVRRAVPVNRPLERAVGVALWSSTAVTAALLALVLVTLLVPTLNFFLHVSPRAFLAGTHWSPESAIRATQVIGEGMFGVLPVLVGSAMVAAIALLLALPVSLAAALHGFGYAGQRHRQAWRLGVRLAALVPTVVYGLFAALTVAPAVAAAAAVLGFDAVIENALAAGLVVGVMLLPVLAMRIGEALEAVPLAAAESALGLGATRWETLRDIVLPAAAPGIGAAVLLAVTRALGETVIVLMAVGTIASWSLDPLGPTTTLTVQIAALMSGTHELGNIRTQLPFVLGLFLAMIVIPLNAWALRMLRRANATPSPVY